jgi:hypothetical protein
LESKFAGTESLQTEPKNMLFPMSQRLKWTGSAIVKAIHEWTKKQVVWQRTFNYSIIYYLQLYYNFKLFVSGQKTGDLAENI